MKLNLKNVVYVLICAVIMFLPRRWFIFGIQSYRVVSILLLVLLFKKIKINTKFLNVFTVIYIFYTAGYYLFDNGLMSFLGFLIDTLGMFIIIYSAVEDKNDFENFITIFIKCITIYSIFCLIQTFTEFNIFDFISGNKPGVASTSVYYRFGLVRSYASFTTSINNALFLVMGAFLIIYRIEKTESKKEKNNVILSFLCVCAAILSTLSRGPMLIFICALLLYLLKKGLINVIIRNIKKIIFVLIILIILFIGIPRVRNATTNFINMFLAIFDDSAVSSISNSFGTNANGIGERALLYKWVNEKIQGNELLGLGPDSTITFKFEDSNNKIRYKTSIENQYLKTLCYFGWIGLISFLIFTIYMLTLNYKLYNKEKKIDFYFFSILTQIVYIIAMFTVASVDDMRMYFLLIGLIFVFYKFREENYGNN